MAALLGTAQGGSSGGSLGGVASASAGKSASTSPSGPSVGASAPIARRASASIARSASGRPKGSSLGRSPGGLFGDALSSSLGNVLGGSLTGVVSALFKPASTPPVKTETPSSGEGSKLLQKRPREDKPAAPASVWETSSENFSQWDSDGNGKLSKEEITTRLRQADLTSHERDTLETLKSHQEELEASEELIDAGEGLTRSDLHSLSRRARVVLFPLEKTAEQLKREKPADLRHLEGTREYFLERHRDFQRRNPDQPAAAFYLERGLKQFDDLQKLKADRGAQAPWAGRTSQFLQSKLEDRRNRSGAEFARLEREASADHGWESVFN